MTDNAEIYCLISRPEMAPALISQRLGLEPSLTQTKGDQIRTPKGEKVEGSFYKFNKWQYLERLGDEVDLSVETSALLRKFLEKKYVLRDIADSQGRISVYFMATELEHRSLMFDPGILAEMAEARISFGFEFF